MTTWVEVLRALTADSELSLRGMIRTAQPDGYSETVGVAGQAFPVMVAGGNRVWRSGTCLRVEREDGTLVFITDGVHAWDFTRDPERPRYGPSSQVQYVGPSQFLLRRRSAAEWSGDDFTRPAGPVEEIEFAGRRCWTVELAPPPHKPYPMRIWVDVETGQMLGAHVESAGVGARFVDLVVGEHLADEMFTWDGPVLTVEDERQAFRDQREALEREQREWFRANVTDAPIRVRLPKDFTPRRMSYHDPATGAFDAMNDATMLSRRPRGVDAFDPGWNMPFYTWSTATWDWAVGTLDAELDDPAVEALQQILHPDEPVDRQRVVDRGYSTG